MKDYQNSEDYGLHCRLHPESKVSISRFDEDDQFHWVEIESVEDAKGVIDILQSFIKEKDALK